ncbi:PREDICTED: BTB/POZ domain-containing protein At1g04390 isoform X2 [Nelumbo nucifera]|uniref:BTB/POZ domain-containing protein At1g04390 isoform X2 n=2 Tax=Nelumbo nucifera TaxID=4432 RepID=A0A1U7ZF42_NELNU|nr:PREDICTED: BTB/POZ domain-containing protein At1g04390 isoform X2 [Nelumbo nucifera]
MKSLKYGAGKNKGVSNHMLTLHQRLLHALNLGIKFSSKDGRKWLCLDIEIQRLAIRSISAFIDCISIETSQHPLVKDSIPHILVALEGILLSRNDTVLGMTVNVIVKLVDVLGDSILKYNVLELVHPLSSLLSIIQSTTAVSCVTALNQILSKLTPWRFKRQQEIWKILKSTNTVDHIVCGLQDFLLGTKSLEYFQEMASLLSTILWRWPSSRYSVWSNGTLLEGLGDTSLKHNSSVKVTILQLYSAIALCGNGTTKLLENGEAPLLMMVQCMGNSHPYSVRIEAFKLVQCLVRSEKSCLALMRLYGKSIVKAILNTMHDWSLCSGKVATNEVALLVEACRLALITRWAGDHHFYFWKFGVHQIILDLLLSNFHKSKQNQHFFFLKELLNTARKGLDANCLLILRPYIWDILGWLAIHFAEDYNPQMHEVKHYLDLLNACACLACVDSIHKGRQVLQNDLLYTSKHEPALRAVLLMVYSPCKYIASQTRHVLSELLIPNEEDLEYLLDALRSTTSKDKFFVSDNHQIVINLMGLACYSCLPICQNIIIKNEGIEVLHSVIRWCCNNQVHIRRSSIASHLYHTSEETICCWTHNDDWEGADILLFFSLWVLSELIPNLSFARNHKEVTSAWVVDVLVLEKFEIQMLMDKLLEICSDTSSPGPKWFATYILSYFGIYGFPSGLGRRIAKALDETELADMKLIPANGEPQNVHTAIIIARCPSLLPPNDLPLNERTDDECAARKCPENFSGNFRRKIRLSSHVDFQALTKLLAFVYSGFTEVGNDLVKNLKLLARRCNVQLLSDMLSKRRPKWGNPFPCYDLTPLLPSGHYFSDIVLEAKVTEVAKSTCNVCSLLLPHVHAHKVILWSSCDYLRALFQSGMQESQSQTIKVPVGWEALVKLVNWFYLDELPKSSLCCLFHNMDVDQQINELEPYIELYWLAEFWFLEEVQKSSLGVVISCLSSNRHLSVKVIQIAANLSLWKMAEAAASYLAPLYPQLRNSGELESLDEELVDLVRSSHVRLSQEGVSDKLE